MAVVPYFLLLWTFLAPFSHAELSCPNPPSSADVFLDMTQLHFVAIQNPGLLQAPKKCSTADGEVTCKNQVCCLNEVGCCYADPKTRGNRCGCRRVEDVECTMTAPLAVVRNSVCEPHEKAAITACLRNKAVEGTHGWLPRISHDSKLIPEKEQSDGYFENEVDFGVLTVAASADY